jgi:predicted O-linked N-acetylglucosamine transferase (SPINDLY family)
MRGRLKRAFDAFVDIRQMTDIEAARQIRAREIDILVDLTGHTKGERLDVLALRPAPVQAHYLGYPGTLGVDFVDYLIADQFVAPSNLQDGFAEKLVYLPGSYQANDRDRPVADDRPTRARCGLPDDAFVFCSFNAAYKIAPTVFDIWVRLAKAVPRAVLWVFADNAWAESNLRREAQARGLSPERLVIAGKLPLPDHLARQPLADLFLDTVPVNAHTTASDALWMGLPVLTCAGRSFAARVAGSLLHAVGLPELVTENLDDYERLALRLATSPGELATLRAKLARNLPDAPLFDAARTTRHIERAYERMWEIYRRGEALRSLTVDPLPS